MAEFRRGDERVPTVYGCLETSQVRTEKSGRAAAWLVALTPAGRRSFTLGQQGRLPPDPLLERLIVDADYVEVPLLLR
jgi:hypothetical protein